MRIKNETDYRTREIRKILTTVHNWLARDEGKLRQWNRGLTFRITYTRQRRGASGHAYLGGYRSTIRLFRPKDGEVLSPVRDLIRVGWHEMLHLYGYNHSQMARRYPGDDEVDEMASRAGFKPTDRLPLYAAANPNHEEPEPTEEERYAGRLRHALRKRKKWTTRARRAKTALAKWRRRENAARRKLEDMNVDVDGIVEDVLGDYEPAMAGDLKV